MRALAAFLVVGHHLNALVGPRLLHVDTPIGAVETTHLFTVGWVGVNVFFVLSGFLLTVHLLYRLRVGTPAEVLRSYLAARVYRVVPAYWAQIVILFVAAWVASGTIPYWARYIPAHLVFLQNTSLQSFDAINGVYWSLPVEFMFYLILPILAFRVIGNAPPKRMVSRAALVAIGAIAVTVVWRHFIYRNMAERGFPEMFFGLAQLPGFADQFGIGILAGSIFVATGSPAAASRRAGIAGDVATIAGLCGLVACMYHLHSSIRAYHDGKAIFDYWGIIAASSIALFVFGAAVGGRIARWIFASPVVLFLGAISYSVYLWHLPVAAYLARQLDMKSLDLWGYAALALPAILLVSIASYYLVEKPGMKLRASRRPAPTSAAHPSA